MVLESSLEPLLAPKMDAVVTEEGVQEKTGLLVDLLELEMGWPALDLDLDGNSVYTSSTEDEDTELPSTANSCLAASSRARRFLLNSFTFASIDV
jgi:hypothetical protein